MAADVLDRAAPERPPDARAAVALEDDGIIRAPHARDAPAHRHPPGEDARGLDLGSSGTAPGRGYFTMSSSSTSKTRVAPGLILGGAPRSP